MADSYVPAYGLGTDCVKVTSAFMVDRTLDRWFEQPFLPVANNAIGQWLMDQVGYVHPRDRITPGRQYPKNA